MRSGRHLKPNKIFVVQLDSKTKRNICGAAKLNYGLFA